MRESCSYRTTERPSTLDRTAGVGRAKPRSLLTRGGSGTQFWPVVLDQYRSMRRLMGEIGGRRPISLTVRAWTATGKGDKRLVGAVTELAWTTASSSDSTIGPWSSTPRATGRGLPTATFGHAGREHRRVGTGVRQTVRQWRVPTSSVLPPLEPSDATFKSVHLSDNVAVSPGDEPTG